MYHTLCFGLHGLFAHRFDDKENQSAAVKSRQGQEVENSHVYRNKHSYFKQESYIKA